MARGLTKYFGEIYDGLSTTLKGMYVTFLHLGRTPITVEYPSVDVEKVLPDRYRGILDVNLEICVSCRLCERACPIQCIKIEDVKAEKKQVPTKDGARQMFKLKNPTRFDIDVGKCMFCGFCVEACPTGAIRHTKRFKGSVFTLEELTYRFVSEEMKKRFLEIEKGIREREEKEKATVPNKQEE